MKRLVPIVSLLALVAILVVCGISSALIAGNLVVKAGFYTSQYSGYMIPSYGGVFHGPDGLWSLTIATRDGSPVPYRAKLVVRDRYGRLVGMRSDFKYKLKGWYDITIQLSGRVVAHYKLWADPAL